MAILLLPVGRVGPVLRGWMVVALDPGVALELALGSLAYAFDSSFNSKQPSFQFVFIHVRILNFAKTGLHPAMRSLVDSLSISAWILLAVCACCALNQCHALL